MAMLNYCCSYICRKHQYESINYLDFSLSPCPPVIDHSKGARLFDVDGNEHIDLHPGFTVDILEHGNAEVNNAIKPQMDRLNRYAKLPVEPRAELAHFLIERHQGDFKKKVMRAVQRRLP
jgi:glutamate-1-semialdehyde aminotransferase